MGEKPFKNPKILSYLSSSTLTMYEQYNFLKVILSKFLAQILYLYLDFFQNY